jgi:hypothetical protein
MHDSAAAGRIPAFVNSAFKRMLTLAVASAMSASVLAAPAAPKAASTPVATKLAAASSASAAAPASSAAETKSTSVMFQHKDPFAGDTWHAVDGTWPGTLVFVTDHNAVTLAPVGATPMKATYTYTVKPSSTGVVEGTLRMTNTAKQVSESAFRIEGKKLTLMYADGQRPEQYVRMTAQEEEAEKARLQKMISEGRIRPLKQ